MSHVRNLLHKPAGHGSDPPPASLSAAPPLVPAVPETVATLSTLPEYPIERVHIRPENRLVSITDPSSPATDRFRYLRMRLRELWSAGKLKKLLLTSPIAHDGKSTIILNLATVLSERGKRAVLVIDGDLHHASIAETLGLNPWSGLAECLRGDATPPLSSIRRVDPLGWHLLPAGEPRQNPTELLQSPAFGNLLRTLSPRFDWILIDSPPVVPLTDALSLQQHTDGSLLVVRADRTPREAVEQAVALLGKQNILGVVLNGVEQRNHLYYQYRYGADKLRDDF
jgi:capsular exopolysaccharide synthesis family protein